MRRQRAGHSAAAIVQPIDDLYKPGSRVRWRDFEVRLKQGYSSFLDLQLDECPSTLDRWPAVKAFDAEHRGPLWSSDDDYSRAKREANAELEMPPSPLAARYNHRSYCYQNRDYLRQAGVGGPPPEHAAFASVLSPTGPRRSSVVRWRDRAVEADDGPASSDLVLDSSSSRLEDMEEDELANAQDSLWLGEADYVRILGEAVDEATRAAPTIQATVGAVSALRVSV